MMWSYINSTGLLAKGRQEGKNINKSIILKYAKSIYFGKSTAFKSTPLVPLMASGRLPCWAPSSSHSKMPTPAEKILNMRASLKTFSHSLCRIILGTPKLTPCLRVWSFFLTREHIEETLTGPYAKSLRGLTQVRVLLTPNALRQGPY